MERYDVVARGCSENRLTYGRSFAVIFACWGYAIFWSIGPFFGFGKYIPEGTLESCAFDFLTRDKETIGFSLGLLVTNYCMPLTIITYCNFYTVMAIIRHNSMLREQATKMNVTALRCSSELIAMSSEVRYAKLVMINLSLWVWAWTPYVGIVMQAVFGDQMQVTPVLTIIPSLFAKCSAITNPLVWLTVTPDIVWFLRSTCTVSALSSSTKKNRIKITPSEQSLPSSLLKRWSEDGPATRQLGNSQTTRILRTMR